MSQSLTPEPRPALRKAPDGSIHPASVVLSSLAVTVAPDAGSAEGPPNKKGKKTGRGKKKAAKEPPAQETVCLQVELPKSVRKALRKRAADYGWTAEEAAAHVIRVWADT